MSKPQANAKVQVDDNDFEQTRSTSWWNGKRPIRRSPRRMIRCPQCGSSQIEYPQMTRKFLTPALASVLFALKIIPKEFYCQDCHYTWSNEGSSAPSPSLASFFPGARQKADSVIEPAVARFNCSCAAALF